MYQKAVYINGDMMWVYTFYYIQDVVKNSTEHILDAARYTTCKLVCSIEGAPANDHRIDVAEVNFSLRMIRNRRVFGWEKHFFLR